MRLEPVTERSFALAAFSSAAVTVAIFIFMAVLGMPVLMKGDLAQLVLGLWSPTDHQYGIRPMILGTIAISSLALCIAMPMSLGCAIFMQVTAPRGMGRLLRHLVQLMTGIPTVVYGFVGIFLLVPIIRESFGRGSGLCVLSAGVMLSLLVAPTMILFFSEGLANVPKRYTMAAAALGATPVQRLIHVMLPQAWRSVLAGIILGFGRAVGDTMIALMLAGNAVAPPRSILDAARTLTAHIALIIAADFDSLAFRTLFICGLVLYLLTTAVVIAMRYVLNKRKTDL